MHHGTGVAVAVAEEIVDDKIADYFVRIDDSRGRFAAFGKRFERGDQPRFVFIVDVCLGARKDVRIAVRIVVDIFELHVVAAHAAETTESAAALHIGRGEIFAGGKIAARGETGAVGHIAGGEVFAGRKASAAGHAGRSEIAALRRRIRRAGGIGNVFLRVELLAEILHIEIASVAAAAAEGHAVRLVEVAGRNAVVALEEAVLHAFDRQIQPPRLAVYVDLHKRAQWRGHAYFVHERIGEIILEVGFILNDIVQTELIQPVIRFARLIMIELDFEAVTIVAVGRDGGKRRVPLCADGDVAVFFAVDYNRAGGVFLVGALLDEAVPVVHDDIERMHAGGIEQAAFVADPVVFADQPGRRRAHIAAGYNERYSQHDAAGAVDVPLSQHGVILLSPYSRRYS